MEYYAQLLDTIFQTLSGDNAPTVLALTTSGSQTGNGNDRHGSDELTLSDTGLPSNCLVHRLASDESFVSQAINVTGHSAGKYVFAFPPLAGEARLSQEWRTHFGRMGVAEALATQLLSTRESPESSRSSQPEVDVLAMLLPRHFVASQRSSAWRQEFFSAHSVLVIEHDRVNFARGLGLGIHSAFQFVTVVFQRHPGPIRFFKINEAALSQDFGPVISDMRRLLRQPAGKSQHGYVYRGVLDEGYPCSFDYYSEETERLRREIGVLGDKVPLSAVADVLRRGFDAIGRQTRSETDTADFFVLHGRDINTDGRIDLTDLRVHSGPPQDVQFLEDGDFCIRTIYSADRGFVVGVYEGDGRAVTWNNTVMVVRPHASLQPAQRQVLLSFLRSPLAHRLGNAKQMASSLGSHLRVNAHILHEFPVPLADEELVSAIQQLAEARAAFNSWISQIDDDSNAILMEATASGSRRRLLKGGQLARQRHRAALQVEDLDYRVRTQFPHPLAYAWRELQVAGADRFYRLRSVTKAAEDHTCFLALIAIVIGRDANVPIRYLEQIATRLAQRNSGTNFGDWFSIIKEVNESRAFRQAAGVLPLAEVTQLTTTERWETAIRLLMDLRNADSHGRIAVGNVPQSMLSEAEAALTAIYGATEFLTDYRFMFITETRFDSLTQITKYQYRDLTGDNALAQLRHDQAGRSDLESGSLYLRDRQGNLHLFRPLLHYMECPICHQMATFYLDTYDRNGDADSVGLKCFERNSVRTEPLADNFRRVGLLST